MCRQTNRAGGRGTPALNSRHLLRAVRNTRSRSPCLCPGRMAPELPERERCEGTLRKNVLFWLQWMALGPFRLPRNREVPHRHLATHVEQSLYIRSSSDHFSEPHEPLSGSGLCYSTDSETPREPETPHFSQAPMKCITRGAGKMIEPHLLSVKRLIP